MPRVKPNLLQLSERTGSHLRQGPAPKISLKTRMTRWFAVLFFLAIQTIPGKAALPSRLILLLDGVSYRDMKALQGGISRKEGNGQQVFRQGFHQDYFPVSRLISTFPSISDPAWTEILGNDPPPGYQRTYFSSSGGLEISRNGITSVVEYEQQMTEPEAGNVRRIASYIFPLKAFKHEVNDLVKNFLNSSGNVTNYYALIHSTDIAQHLSGDILSMLDVLDEKLQELRALYRVREGKELEILILSDHGNNHGGTGKRVDIRGFLKKAGYQITKSLQNPKDVVLPTAGIESWVEIHNAPSETDRLVSLLAHLDGVDVVTAQLPNTKNRFLVANSKGERAFIDCNADQTSFRYSTEIGDPIGYLPVLEILAQNKTLNPDGFAAADAWMAQSLSHRYPLALERIVRGHTQIARNPASILIGLKNDYVHCEWLIRRGVVLVKSGGTHGGLDDLNSNGIFLSSFAPTRDTSTSRVKALCDGFIGLNDRRDQCGARWIWAASEGEVTIPGLSAGKKCLLQIWNPAFAFLELETPIEVTIETLTSGLPAQIPRVSREPAKSSKSFVTFHQHVTRSERDRLKRIFDMPTGFVFNPRSCYRISGQIRGQEKQENIFNFTFSTDRHALPLVQ